MGTAGIRCAAAAAQKASETEEVSSGPKMCKIWPIPCLQLSMDQTIVELDEHACRISAWCMYTMVPVPISINPPLYCQVIATVIYHKRLYSIFVVNSVCKSWC